MPKLDSLCSIQDKSSHASVKNPLTLSTINLKRHGNVSKLPTPKTRTMENIYFRQCLHTIANICK